MGVAGLMTKPPEAIMTTDVDSLREDGNYGDALRLIVECDYMRMKARELMTTTR